MSRLVVFAGAHGTGWDETRRCLDAWTDQLQEHGVWGPGTVRGLAPPAWRRFADTEDDGALAAACREATGLGATTVISGSEDLEDPLRDAAYVSALEALAASAELALTVVVVVRDQIGALNALYCDRVTQLATAKDFDSFVADPQPSERFDYGTAFEALLAAPSAELVAVRYQPDPDALARAILEAVGLAADVVATLPSDERRPSVRTLPGPFTVGALRLLHKRFRRNGLMHRLGHRRLVEASQQLVEESELAGWDDAPFWGWSSESRTAAIARFGPGNDAFARAVWQRPWGDDWADGTHSSVDLASSEPETVVALLTAVDQTLNELREGLGERVNDGADATSD